MFGSDKPKPPQADEALIMAFVSEYESVETEELADDVFDFARLREYFGAFQIPKMPDPLPPYTRELTEEHGFVFRMSYSGDPALFVRRKNKPKTYGFTPSLEWDSPTPDPSPKGAGSLPHEERLLIGVEDSDDDDDIFRMAGYDEEEESPTPALPQMGGSFYEEDDDDEDE